jgi:hypothetical protein
MEKAYPLTVKHDTGPVLRIGPIRKCEMLRVQWLLNRWPEIPSGTTEEKGGRHQYGKDCDVVEMFHIVT